VIMPTGQSNSPQVKNALSGIPTKPTGLLPRGAINVSLPIIFQADDVPQHCPPFQVPIGASVNVRGSNGTNAGNSEPCFIGTNKEELSNGGGRQVTPDTEIFFPVDNTVQVWARGKAGDGVQVYVTGNPIG